jgi:hypothetical protein
MNCGSPPSSGASSLRNAVPGALLDLAFLKSFDTMISPALLDELDEKLRGKFEVSAEDASAIRARIVSIAHLVEGPAGPETSKRPGASACTGYRDS